MMWIRKAIHQWMIVPVAIIAMLLASCSNNNVNNNDNARSNEPIQSNNTSLGISNGWNPNKLAGGPEMSAMSVQPGVNSALQRKYPSILALRGSLKSKRIAFTFDDGPDKRFTPQMLDVLKKHGVKATFFLMGARVAALPTVTRRIHEEGHAIGNHSYWHPKLWQESKGRVSWEITETDKAIKNAVGYSPKLLRAPYGGLTDAVVKQLGDMRFSIIGWNVDSEDWRQIEASAVQHNIMKDLQNGAIVLMHSGGDWTQDLSNGVKALDTLIPMLKKQGYELVTVPELLQIPLKK